MVVTMRAVATAIENRSAFRASGSTAAALARWLLIADLLISRAVAELLKAARHFTERNRQRRWHALLPSRQVRLLTGM
jgi:hypothetical protein